MPSTMLYGTLPPGFSTGSQIPSAQPDPTQGGGLQATGGGAPPTYPPWAGSRTRRNTPQALPGVLPAPPASSIQATLQVGLFRLELTRLDSTFAPPYWVAQAWNSPWGVWSVLAELSDRARGEVMAFPPQVGHALLQAMVLIPIFWEHPEEALYAVLPFIIRLLHGRRLCFSASCACTHRRAALRRCQRTTDAPAPVLKSVHTALTQPTRCHPVPTPRHTCRARTEAGPTRTAGPTRSSALAASDAQALPASCRHRRYAQALPWQQPPLQGAAAAARVRPKKRRKPAAGQAAQTIHAVCSLMTYLRASSLASHFLRSRQRCVFTAHPWSAATHRSHRCHWVPASQRPPPGDGWRSGPCGMAASPASSTNLRRRFTHSGEQNFLQPLMTTSFCDTAVPGCISGGPSARQGHRQTGRAVCGHITSSML